MKYIHPALVACSILALVACRKDAPESAVVETMPGPFDALVLQSPPAEARTIAQARSSVEPGQVVVLLGKVMGRKDPFVEGRAMMVIGDPDKLGSCDLNPDDECSTPWDVCCEDPDTIKKFTATIQVLDKDGKLIKSGLKGVHGIKELSHVVIVGTIAEGSGADNLLVTATGIFVKP